MIIPWGLAKKLSVVAAVLLLPQLVCAGSFKLGSISTSPVAETHKFWPLASYLARKLQSEGINQGRVVVAESIPALSSFLQTRQIDLYIDSFFPSMAVSRLSGSKLLLRRWKMGKSEYQSVIFTRKDSGIARLKDLKGKVIAFEEPFGSTGYFFPKMALLEKGLRLAPKRRGIDPVKSDEVGYIFSHSDSQTIFLVLNGVVAAGATDDQKYLMLAKNLDSFKIIHETVSFPRQIVSYRADLPAKLVTRVKEVLLNMHQTDEGRQVLQAFESTTKFEEIPVRDIELMEGLRKHVDAELKLKR
ncbi:MAG: phosphate/phosphite/phosphonate ABC transporter substrate-binding protein [Candidatus Binatia bacterium]